MKQKNIVSEKKLQAAEKDSWMAMVVLGLIGIGALVGFAAYPSPVLLSGGIIYLVLAIMWQRQLFYWKEKRTMLNLIEYTRQKKQLDDKERYQ